MQPIEKQKLKIQQEKENKMEFIIEQASEIFCERGIYNTKMTDIAKKAEVGVASVYRYFKTKADIAIQVGIKFWEDEGTVLYEKFQYKEFEEKSGYEQVKDLLNSFVDLFEHHKDFLKYINYLDSFILKENIDRDKLKEYEKSIVDIKELAVNAIKKGQQDNTIRSDINAEEYYITMTHTVISLSQKLIMSNGVLKSDINISEKKQIEILIDMMLKYVRN